MSSKDDGSPIKLNQWLSEDIWDRSEEVWKKPLRLRRGDKKEWGIT